MTPAPYIPAIELSDSVLDAALKYANAGLYIFPVMPGDKVPASHEMPNGWATDSSNDPAQIAAWFSGTNYSIGLHAGKSGLFVIDIDNPSAMNELMRKALAEDFMTGSSHPVQSTRRQGGAAHHLFAMPTPALGNAIDPALKSDGNWGDVRGANGYIVVAPSVHQKSAEGGQYVWNFTGPVPPVPDSISRYFGQAGQHESTVTRKEVERFLDSYTQESNPNYLKSVLQRYWALTDGGGSRHNAMTDALCQIMRESRMGFYSARKAFDELTALHLQRVQERPRTDKRNVNLQHEVWQAAGWAVAQAGGMSAQEVSQRAAGVSERLVTEDSLSALHKLTGGRVTPTGAVLSPVRDLDTSSVDEAGVEAQEADEGPVSSWGRIDLTEYLQGTHEEKQPELFMRIDGQCLLYRGLVHSFHGESESGKSWLAQIEAARVLASGGRVAYIDYESNPSSVVARFLLLGASSDDLAERLHYLRPERAPWSLDEVGEWEALLAEELDYVVLDGVTEALSTMAISSKDNDELTAWIRAVPRKIAHSTGAALVMVDHVVKNREEGGRFAIGGQAKMAALDGAAFVIEVGKPLGKGLRGEIVMRLAKDREGGLRGIAGKFRPSDRTQEIARVVVDSTSGSGIEVTVGMPNSAAEAEEAGTDIQASGLRPCVVMESMSRFIETAPTAPTANTLTKDMAIPIDGRRPTREYALKYLLKEGYVTTEAGPRRAVFHVSVKPYRVADDPSAPVVESTTSALNKLVGQDD